MLHSKLSLSLLQSIRRRRSPPVGSLLDDQVKGELEIEDISKIFQLNLQPNNTLIFAVSMTPWPT